jgi:hypothetical protein
MNGSVRRQPERRGCEHGSTAALRSPWLRVGRIPGLQCCARSRKVTRLASLSPISCSTVSVTSTAFPSTTSRVLDEPAVRFPKGKKLLMFEPSGNIVEFGPALPASGRMIAELLRDRYLPQMVHITPPIDSRRVGCSLQGVRHSRAESFEAQLIAGEADQLLVRAEKSVALDPTDHGDQFFRPILIDLRSLWQPRSRPAFDTEHRRHLSRSRIRTCLTR